MVSLNFDTLKFSKVLQDKAKLTPEQAEGFVEAIYGLLQEDIATKPDLQALELRLNAKLRELELSLKADMQALEAKLNVNIQVLEAKLQQSELNLENKIQSSKVEILKYLFGTIGLQILVILGAVLFNLITL